MIPIVPMPVFPYPDWDPVFGPDLRASDADRDVAADILCAAVADGRLTLAELDERLEEVLSARTLREIARRISDLPGQALPARRPSGRPARAGQAGRLAVRSPPARNPVVPPPVAARNARRPQRPARLTLLRPSARRRWAQSPRSELLLVRVRHYRW